MLVHPHFCVLPFKGENRGGAATITDWSQPVVLFCAHLGIQGNSIPATATEGWHSFFFPWPELCALLQGSRVELHGVANNATLEAESSMAAAGISDPSSDEPGVSIGQRNITGCLSAADVLRYFGSEGRRPVDPWHLPGRVLVGCSLVVLAATGTSPAAGGG